MKLQPGATAITGDNGKGKSSIIRAIAFLFTGEVDTDTKKECVTVGEAEGWVKGTFKHNDKVGSLERHLSSSKVILTYDGVVYNKVSEVNLLWNDLLKIDSAIFNNVIIANQGEIQKLFSDETAVREKIFQKIFLVPPTEKLRALIWDNYIKTCSPERSAEDIVVLQTSQAGVAAERNHILEEMDRLTVGVADPVLIQSVQERIYYLDKCLKDAAKRPELLNRLQLAQNEVTQLQLSITGLDQQISENNLPQLRAQYEKLLLNKTAHGRKVSITTELETLLNVVPGDDEFLAMQKQAHELQVQTDELRTQSIEDSAKLREVSGKISKFTQLTGHANCPTCNQILPDIQAFLSEQRKDETELKARIATNNNKASVAGRAYQAINSKISSAETTYNRVKYLTNEVTMMGEVEYSEQQFNDLKVSIQSIEKAIRSVATLRASLTNYEGEICLINERLQNLASYNGNSSIAEELEVMQSALNEDNRVRQEISKLDLQAAKLQHELELYSQRIKVSEQNGEYNKRRKEYIDRLTQAYDVLHVSRFPRKLIETYMEQVQTTLSGYLEHFDLPYSVRISDGFKIGLVNSEGHLLPTVSGGQEVMVGICLRLALHKMFAKSFPLWIIDEGTTHLSETKKPQYFSLINELRNQKIINQILIIDHDERLNSVVDQTVQL